MAPGQFDYDDDDDDAFDLCKRCVYRKSTIAIAGDFRSSSLAAFIPSDRVPSLQQYLLICPCLVAPLILLLINLIYHRRRVFHPHSHHLLRPHEQSRSSSSLSPSSSSSSAAFSLKKKILHNLPSSHFFFAWEARSHLGSSLRYPLGKWLAI